MTKSGINSIHAEKAIMGSLLVDNTSYDDIADFINIEDFSSFQYRDYYKAIKYLLSKNSNADVITVSQTLSTENGKINFENTYSENAVFIELCEIANSAFTSTNIKQYANIVKKSSINRKIIKASQKIISSVHDGDENALDTAQKLISDISDSVSSEITAASDIIDSVVTIIDQRQHLTSEITGIATGFIDLDKMTHGLHGGDLIILAARPGMGKTLLAMNIAEYVSVLQKNPVIIFSLEMKKEQLIERSIASLTNVDSNAIKSGKLSAIDFNKIASIIPDYQTSNLFIDDHVILTVSDIRAKCRRIMRKNKLALIVIDYISLMAGEGETETLRISNISRGLKLLARDLNVPIIAISQLNRALEQRQDKRPCMADLRQSGAIEQDADLILFIYRDEIYNRETDYPKIAELIVAKHRNGNTGTINLVFNGEHCRFDNYTGQRIRHHIQKKIQNNNPFQY